MAGSEAYRIVPWKKFESTFRKTKKVHYRKNKKARAEFEGLVINFLRDLCCNPRPEKAERMQCPSSITLPEGFELWKMRWRPLPGLRGAAGYGRLLYVIDETYKLVYPFWIYTHAEYSEETRYGAQPPGKEIASELKGIIAHAQNLEQ